MAPPDPAELPQPEQPAVPPFPRPGEGVVPAAAGSKPARSFRIGPLVGWAAVAVALLGAGSVPWLLSDPQRLSSVLGSLAPELDADIVVGGARIGWTGPILLEDVRIVPRRGGVEPVVIPRIEVEHGLARIALSLGDLGRVRIDSPRVRVVFNADRTSNLTTLARPREIGSSAPRRRLSLLRMQVEVVDAIVRIDGPWEGEPWSSGSIALEASLAASAEGPWSEWTIQPCQVLDRAMLQPSVAQGVLVYVAPELAGATRMAGLFSLSLDGGRLPLGDPGSGTLAGTLSMHAVDLGPGPIVQQVVARLPAGLPIPPSIRIADDADVRFRLDERRVWHEGLEFGVPLPDPGMRLDVESRGSVGLDDGSLDLTLSLPFPTQVPPGRPVLQVLAGRTISVGVKGELGRPEVVFDGSIRTVIGGVLEDLFGGGGPGLPPTGAGPDAMVPPIVEGIGGVLDGIARRRAERQAAASDAPSPAVRPRLRDRLRARLPRGASPDSRPAEALPQER
jgi:hypothetical protein